MGNRRKDVRCQQVRGRARLDPEGIDLILHQVRVAPEPEQLQHGFQLREVLLGGNQR
jgi:hypothetical protein